MKLVLISDYEASTWNAEAAISNNSMMMKIKFSSQNSYIPRGECSYFRSGKSYWSLCTLSVDLIRCNTTVVCCWFRQWKEHKRLNAVSQMCMLNCSMAPPCPVSWGKSLSLSLPHFLHSPIKVTSTHMRAIGEIRK